MKTLVTGVGGFLGGAIASQLLDSGMEVRTLSRRPLPEWRERGVEVIRGDLTSLEDVEQATRGVSLVYHVAAKAGIWGSYADYWDANVAGTEHVIAACHKHGVGRLIYTSSPSAVSDGQECLGANEDKPYPENFMNHYCETKCRAEQRALAAHGQHGLSVVALRPHLIWGPGDPHLVPRVVRSHDSGRLRRVGAGRNLVDMCYIDNAAEAHLLAAKDLSATSPHGGKAYFISNGEPICLWEWIDFIMEGLGRPPVRRSVTTSQAWWAGAFLEWTYKTLRLSGEPPMTRYAAYQLGTSHYFDISAARRDFGYQPRIGYQEGMQRMLSHFQEVFRSSR